MANDYYCDDSYLQQQQDLEEQEFLLWQEEKQIELANELLRSISHERT